MDFIVDGLATGRMVRILSVVDAYTRECLALEADTSLGSGRVTRVLERLIGERGRPENLRSDNGPEFTSRRMLGWTEDCNVELVHIANQASGSVWLAGRRTSICRNDTIGKERLRPQHQVCGL